MKTTTCGCYQYLSGMLLVSQCTNLCLYVPLIRSCNYIESSSRILSTMYYFGSWESCRTRILASHSIPTDHVYAARLNEILCDFGMFPLALIKIIFAKCKFLFIIWVYGKLFWWVLYGSIHPLFCNWIKNIFIFDLTITH